jgi:hypothetical protein
MRRSHRVICVGMTLLSAHRYPSMYDLIFLVVSSPPLSLASIGNPLPPIQREERLRRRQDLTEVRGGGEGRNYFFRKKSGWWVGIVPCILSTLTSVWRPATWPQPWAAWWWTGSSSHTLNHFAGPYSNKRMYNVHTA